MTREEAIERLNIHKSTSVFVDSIAEAIDMAISALQDMPIHFGRCWDCVSFIAEGEKCKWDLLTGEDGYCHHFFEKYGELNCITESPNDVIEKNDEVIKSVRCKDCEWFDNCESFVTPPCTKQTEPSDKGGDAEMRNDRTYTNAPYMQETPSEDGSDLISREDLLKKAEKGNITKYSTNSVNIITTDVVTVENIKKAPSADTPTTEVKKPTNTPTDLISRADALEQMAQAACGLHYEDCEADNCSCSYIGRILDLPSVSAERVIRCKDCEYRDKTKVNKKGFEVCVASGMDITDNDFCSLAKMKGGAE